MSRFTTTTNSRTWIRVIAAMLLSSGIVAAEEPGGAMQPSGSSVWDTPTGGYHQPVSQYPVEMGFWQDHSSTLQEGIQRGHAAVIQARGIYEVNHAQANVIGQQARALDLQNDLKLIAAKQVRRELRHQAHVENRKEHERSRAEGLMIQAERKATIHRAAYQLSADDFNRTTGEIRWPAALQDAKYRAHREQIEELFRSQFAYAEPQPAKTHEIERSLAALAKAFRSELGNLPSSDYFDAHKFLRGLAQEAQLRGNVG